MPDYSRVTKAAAQQQLADVKTMVKRLQVQLLCQQQQHLLCLMQQQLQWRHDEPDACACMQQQLPPPGGGRGGGGAVATWQQGQRVTGGDVLPGFVPQRLLQD